jgi:hypothetical protein
MGNVLERLPMSNNGDCATTFDPAYGCTMPPARTSHGHRKGGSFSLTYMTWRAVIQRCTSYKHPMYEHYGELPCTDGSLGVCQSWRTFTNFLADVGERPSRGHTIDRIERDVGYQPGNTRWATGLQQARNRDDCGGRFLTHPTTGERLRVKAWAKKLHVNPDTIRKRIKRKWSLDRVLSTRKPKKRRPVSMPD